LLCEHGADVDAPMDHLGLTALRQAAGKPSFDIVHYLLEQGADFSEPRPVDELNTFMYLLQHMKPGYFAMTPHNQKWFTAVWEWFEQRGKDPEKAKWTGTKWVWED
jgi:hypothetical protein